MLNQKNIRVLCSPGTKFTSESGEGEIRSHLESLGLKVPEVKSKASHTLIIKHKGSIIGYISRTLGLNKGLLRIIIDPKKAAIQDVKVSHIEGVTTHNHPKKSVRFTTSSNYKAFNSIGFCSELTSNEHVGAGYNIDVNSGFVHLKEFFKVFVE